MKIEWQLPVNENATNGKGFTIHGNSKIHCYANGSALCDKRIWIMMDYWETTDYGEKDIDTYPQYFCKKCVNKFKKITSKKYSSLK